MAKFASTRGQFAPAISILIAMTIGLAPVAALLAISAKLGGVQ